MSAKVVTITTCNRCGAKHEVEGPTDAIPRFWASYGYTIGVEWNGGKVPPRVDGHLCQKCVDGLLDFLIQRHAYELKEVQP